MADPVIVPRAEHPISAKTSIRTPSRSCIGCATSTTPPIWWAAACGTCCWVESRRISTSAPTRTRIRSRSCSGTAGSSDVASAWRTCASAPRPSRSPRSGAMWPPTRYRCTPRTKAGTAGRGAPTAARAIGQPAGRRRTGAATTTPLARPKRTPSGATSRSTRCSTTSRRSRSSITSAAWRTCAAGVIRCIGDPLQRFQEDPVRMLRAVVVRRAARLHARPADRRGDPPAAPPDGVGLAGAADRGVLQDPPLRSRRADVPHAGRARAARTGHARNCSAARPTNRCGTSLRALDTYRQRFADMPPQLTNPVLLGIAAVADRADAALRHADEHDDATEAADADVAEDAGRRRGAGSRAARVLVHRPPRSPPEAAGAEDRHAADCAARYRAPASAAVRAVDACATWSRRRAPKRALMHRGPFEDALTWLEIHGQRAGDRRALAWIHRGAGGQRAATRRRSATAEGAAPPPGDAPRRRTPRRGAGAGGRFAGPRELSVAR